MIPPSDEGGATGGASAADQSRHYDMVIAPPPVYPTFEQARRYTLTHECWAMLRSNRRLSLIMAPRRFLKTSSLLFCALLEAARGERVVYLTTGLRAADHARRLLSSLYATSTFSPAVLGRIRIFPSLLSNLYDGLNGLSGYNPTVLLADEMATYRAASQLLIGALNAELPCRFLLVTTPPDSSVPGNAEFYQCLQQMDAERVRRVTCDAFGVWPLRTREPLQF